MSSSYFEDKFVYRSLSNFVLHVMSHVYANPSGSQIAAFGKRGILHLRFRKTVRHIAAFTLHQMCCLFYLKGATHHTKLAELIPHVYG